MARLALVWDTKDSLWYSCGTSAQSSELIKVEGRGLQPVPGALVSKHVVAGEVCCSEYVTGECDRTKGHAGT